MLVKSFRSALVACLITLVPCGSAQENIAKPTSPQGSQDVNGVWQSSLVCQTGKKSLKKWLISLYQK
ncbi:GD20382 [Drosophila simulans]|uniref:GD20382 n=1 Tax=Drosophila simulans TaxID=7240 RepID=B4QZ55_DROSI|nr:GD20382 [Drosophila simulans]